MDINACTNKADFDGIVSYCEKAIERAESSAPMTNDEKQVFTGIALDELHPMELVRAVSYIKRNTDDPLDTLDRFVTEQSLRHGPGSKHTRRGLVDTLGGHVVNRL
jgi:hypothetical protein